MKQNMFKASYETNSFVFLNEEIKLNIEYEDCEKFIWESLNEDIATVSDGVVKGINDGNVVIRVFPIDDTSIYYDFGVTVLNNNVPEIIKDLLKAHNSNILLKKDFNVCNAYKTNIIESVSKYLFEDLNINNDYLPLGKKKWENSEVSEYMKSIEFITVHYTANFRSGANALAHANYFVSDTHNTSIHYNTGNDGVFHCLDDNIRAAHAGDSSGPEFEWVDTGIEYDGCDLLKVKVTVDESPYYYINGKKSIIRLPDTYSYRDEKTNHVILDNGEIINELTKEKRNAESYFNKMGFRFKVIDGKYFMSKSWWCYSLVDEGRICNVGGNRNSIGIESCVNEGSDLWYTWQITAKLVAKLMKDNNLTIDRVVGHHFFTAKNCPAPLLVNDLELWYKFIELVEYEYLFLTKYENYNIALININNDDVLENGRIIDGNSGKFSYKLIILDKEKNKEFTIILYSIVRY